MKKNKPFNILFVGDLNEGTRSLMRLQILKEFGGVVKCLTNTPVPFIAGVDKPTFYTRILNKLRIPRDEVGINEALIEAAKSDDIFDIAWIEKSTMLRPSSLKYFKKKSINTQIISLSEDDMYALHNRSRYYEYSLNLYDTVFTTKLYNLHELKTLGAKDTKLFLDSYDSKLHRPLDIYNQVRDKDLNVSFIGTFEKERSDIIMWLGSKGVKVTVYGNGWSSMIGKDNNITIMNKAILAEEYVEIINRTKINLGFLRKINRDEVTSRSMEITGCKSFLLAERTSRHTSMFEEGKEAEFFSNKEELLKKIKFYLNNESALKEISIKGRDRCLNSGYDMENQVINILKYLI
jgi:spore maturation protein CgeB